jgi:diaminopimelate epimerase
MQFIKMHGIGNDYVYINGFVESVVDPAALAPVIADRHTGVGGDGLILLLPAEKGVDAHVRMRMFNADGSESEMCGNGIRCVCKLAHDHGVCDANPMKIQTGNGVLTLQYELDAAHKVQQVRVNMGAPILTPAKVPVAIDQTAPLVNYDMTQHIDWANTPAGDAWIEQSGTDMRITCVSMGNPHVTLYCNDVSKVPLESVGPLLERHPLFPARINVHFVQVHSDSEVTMRTWERGSGITLACGTGASAVCVSGVLTGNSGVQILAHLPGGDLTLQWAGKAGDDTPVFMTGSATEVFTGNWPG